MEVDTSSLKGHKFMRDIKRCHYDNFVGTGRFAIVANFLNLIFK